MHIFTLVMSNPERVEPVREFLKSRKYKDSKGREWPVYLRELKMYELITQEVVAEQLMADLGSYEGVEDNKDFHFKKSVLGGFLEWLWKLSPLKKPPEAKLRDSMKKREKAEFHNKNGGFYTMVLGVLPCEHVKEGTNSEYGPEIEKV